MLEKGGGFKCGRTGTRLLVPIRPKVNLRSVFSASLIHQLEYIYCYVSLYVEWNSSAPLQNKMHFVAVRPRNVRPPAGYGEYIPTRLLLQTGRWQVFSRQPVDGSEDAGRVVVFL